MSYESAPATTMLATHCAVCARPLVDSVSVEAGIGPDCREKYGYLIDCDSEARAEANLLVSRIARDQRGPEVGAACARLLELGFDKLAHKVLDRVAAVRIAPEGDRLAVESRFSPESVELLRKVPGRRWDGERKINTFPASSKPALWAAIRRAYPGAIGIGPRGIFLIDQAA